MTRKSYFASFFIFLLITWLSFSGFFKLQFIAYGIISCVLALLFIKKMVPIYDGFRPAYLRAGLLLYLPWLFWQMVLSSYRVTKAVWRVDIAVEPSLAWVNTKQEHPLGYTFYAHSISLTPGTVCAEVKDGMIQVHALDKFDVHLLQEGNMDQRIIKALGDD